MRVHSTLLFGSFLLLNCLNSAMSFVTTNYHPATKSLLLGNQKKMNNQKTSLFAMPPPPSVHFADVLLPTYLGIGFACLSYQIDKDPEFVKDFVEFANLTPKKASEKVAMVASLGLVTVPPFAALHAIATAGTSPVAKTTKTATATKTKAAATASKGLFATKTAPAATTVTTKAATLTKAKAVTTTAVGKAATTTLAGSTTLPSLATCTETSAKWTDACSAWLAAQTAKPTVVAKEAIAATKAATTTKVAATATTKAVAATTAVGMTLSQIAVPITFGLATAFLSYQVDKDPNFATKSLQSLIEWQKQQRNKIASRSSDDTATTPVSAGGGTLAVGSSASAATMGGGTLAVGSTASAAVMGASTDAAVPAAAAAVVVQEEEPTKVQKALCVLQSLYFPWLPMFVPPKNSKRYKAIKFAQALYLPWLPMVMPPKQQKA